MQSFDDFLLSCAPTIKEATIEAVKNMPGANDLENAAYISTQVTLTLLRNYHEWLTQQLS